MALDPRTALLSGRVAVMPTLLVDTGVALKSPRFVMTGDTVVDRGDGHCTCRCSPDDRPIHANLKGRAAPPDSGREDLVVLLGLAPIAQVRPQPRPKQPNHEDAGQEARHRRDAPRPLTGARVRPCRHRRLGIRTARLRPQLSGPAAYRAPGRVLGDAHHATTTRLRSMRRSRSSLRQRGGPEQRGHSHRAHGDAEPAQAHSGEETTRERVLTGTQQVGRQNGRKDQQDRREGLAVERGETLARHPHER